MTAELRFFIRAREARVFQDLDAAKVRLICEQAGGRDIVVFLCGDCRHSRDKMVYLMEKTFPDNDLHLLGFNGGAILIDACSPANNLGLDLSPAAQFEIIQALKKKPDAHQVLLEAHWPCGVAGDANISVEGQVRSLIVGKRHLRDRIRSELNRKVHIGLLFHVHRTDVAEEEVRRMYYFCDEQMEEFMVTYSEDPSSVIQVA